MRFTVDGAKAAHEIIEDAYNQAYGAFVRSIIGENSARATYWLERVDHLERELIWIELEMKKAAAEQTDRPEYNFNGSFNEKYRSRQY